jgi:hypothetical protein
MSDKDILSLSKGRRRQGRVSFDFSPTPRREPNTHPPLGAPELNNRSGPRARGTGRSGRPGCRDKPVRRATGPLLKNAATAPRARLLF